MRRGPNRLRLGCRPMAHLERSGVKGVSPLVRQAERNHQRECHGCSQRTDQSAASQRLRTAGRFGRFHQFVFLKLKNRLPGKFLGDLGTEGGPQAIRDLGKSCRPAARVPRGAGKRIQGKNHPVHRVNEDPGTVWKLIDHKAIEVCTLYPDIHFLGAHLSISRILGEPELSTRKIDSSDRDKISGVTDVYIMGNFF
jgi:hypothetical protein